MGLGSGLWTICFGSLQSTVCSGRGKRIVCDFWSAWLLAQLSKQSSRAFQEPARSYAEEAQNTDHQSSSRNRLGVSPWTHVHSASDYLHSTHTVSVKGEKIDVKCLRALIYHLEVSHQLWQWKYKGRVQSFFLLRNSLKHKRKITVCLAWLSTVQRQLTPTWICGLVAQEPSRWSKLLRLEMRKLRPQLACRQTRALCFCQSNSNTTHHSVLSTNQSLKHKTS